MHLDDNQAERSEKVTTLNELGNNLMSAIF